MTLPLVKLNHHLKDPMTLSLVKLNHHLQDPMTLSVVKLNHLLIARGGVVVRKRDSFDAIIIIKKHNFGFLRKFG